MQLLLIASALAFPVSYVVMKEWLEAYNRQITIGITPFAINLVGIAAFIALSIGHRIWRAANENPSEVIKSE